MRIGVVSDTHNHLDNVQQIVRLFNAAGVARVIHTGDITQAKTLDAFAALDAPLFGVFGNNDHERAALEAVTRRHGFHFVEPPLVLEWHARRIVVVHDPRELDGFSGPHDVALHGHTHLRRIEHRDGRLVFNPGESAGHMRGANAIGIVDLSRLTAEILNF